MIHNGCLQEQLLRVRGGLNHLFNFVLQIVTLIHHVGNIGSVSSLPREVADFVKNAEDLIGVHAPQGQIVIRVAPVIEMEAPQHVLAEQPGNDLLHVLRLIMVPGITKTFARGPQCLQKIQDIPQSAMSVA